MKKVSLVLMATIFILTGVGQAVASGTAAEAKAMVEKAAAFLSANGKEKALAEFNNPKGQFVKDDLYIFVNDLNGKTLAHGGNQKLVGKDMLGLKDADGKPFIKDMTDAAKAKKSGWIEYKWTNPTTKKVDDKSTYYMLVDDVIIGCGIYKK